MSDHRNSETSEKVTETDETARFSAKAAESFQHATNNLANNLSKPLRCSEKVELWLRAGYIETARPSSEKGTVLQQGWLAPYIEHDLKARMLTSSEKVELWIRAHFSHPARECFQDREGISVQKSKIEKSNATESVITSLAALEILP